MNKWLAIILGTCACVLTAGGWMVASELSATLRATAEAERAFVRVADELPGKVLPALTQEVDDLGNALVTTADKRLGSIEAKANEQLSFALTNAATKLDKLIDAGNNAITKADGQIGAVVTLANKTVDKVDPLLANSAETVKAVQPVLANLKSVTGQIDYALPDYLNCEWNEDCVFNRYQGASKAFERAMLKVPAMATSGAGIADDVHKITTTAEKAINPPPVHGIWGHTKQIAGIARDLVLGYVRFKK